VGSRTDPQGTHPRFYVGNDQCIDKSIQVPRQTTIHVLVTSTSGAPIARARVSLRKDRKSITHNVFTKPDGKARLVFVPEGNYDLMIDAVTFKPLVEVVHVNRGNPYIEMTRELLRVQ